jgi:hypothetical protein
MSPEEGILPPGHVIGSSEVLFVMITNLSTFRPAPSFMGVDLRALLDKLPFCRFSVQSKFGD